MIEYMETIIPKLKSELRQSGKRSFFSVIASTDKRYICFNRYLWDGLIVGEETKIRVAEGKRHVITDIIGFNPDYPITKTKPPRNKAEADLFKLMEKEGWELTKRGWPDFACFKDGKLVLVEVKPKRGHRLKVWQSRLMMELVKHDIKCYRWSPDGGFEPVLGHIKFPVNLP